MYFKVALYTHSLFQFSIIKDHKTYILIKYKNGESDTLGILQNLTKNVFL